MSADSTTQTPILNIELNLKNLRFFSVFLFFKNNLNYFSCIHIIWFFWENSVEKLNW